MSLKVQCVNFSAFEPISAAHGISAAVVIPAGSRIVATSGHVGIDDTGVLQENLREQMKVAFLNVERSILAVDNTLSRKEVWESVYQINTYHAGGLAEDVFIDMAEAGKEYLGEHKPAWTALGVDGLVYGRFEIAVFAALK